MNVIAASRPLFPGGPGLPTAEELALIARIAEAEAGIVIPPTKASMVQSRLAPRLRRLGCDSYRSYAAFVSSPEGDGERREMIAALTTNVSQFFRERHHFDLLRAEILPPLIARARAGGRVRLWSAGCSNGQEAYSVAMTLLDLMPDAGRSDIRILGTDIDPNVVGAARRAEYDAAGLQAIPGDLARRFVALRGPSGTLTDEVRSLVRFEELNLHAAWPMRGRFDVILCRNVVIYFATARQEALWSRFAAALPAGGWLIVGHSERVPAGPGAPFAAAGITAYRRQPVPRTE